MAASRVGWTALIAAVLLYALVAIARDPLRINHDCAQFLQAGFELLDGRLPYVGVVDTNPPLILYLNTLPAAISRALDVHPIPTFLAGVWLLTVVSTFATRSILARTFAPHESLLSEFVALGIALSALLVLRDNFFGQREHLFVLAFFPYLAFRFRHWEDAHSPRMTAIAAGLLAGIFACLKPHFVVIALAPEIYWLATRRRTGPLLRPEFIAFVSVGFAYAIHFLLLPQPVRIAFFERWLPLVARAYEVYDLSLSQILRTWPRFWQMTVASIVVLFVRPRRDGVGWRLAAPLVAVIVTAMTMFLVQHKGFRYHGIPIGANALLLFALCAGQGATRLLAVFGKTPHDPVSTSRSDPHQVGSLTIAAGLAAAGLAFVSCNAVISTSAPVSQQPLARAIADASREGEPILVISSSVPHSYPTLLQLRRRPGSRFLSCFPIPMFYAGLAGTPGQPFPYRGTEEGGVPTDEEAAFLADLAADISTIRPKAVLIDTGGCQACPAGFEIHDYLERNSFIATALSRYRRAGLVDDLALYLPAEEVERDAEDRPRRRARRQHGKHRARPG